MTCYYFDNEHSSCLLYGYTECLGPDDCEEYDDLRKMLATGEIDPDLAADWDQELC